MIVFYLTRSLIALIIAHAVWDTAVLLLPRLPVFADTGWVWYVTLGTPAALGIAGDGAVGASTSDPRPLDVCRHSTQPP